MFLKYSESLKDAGQNVKQCIEQFKKFSSERTLKPYLILMSLLHPGPFRNEQSGLLIHVSLNLNVEPLTIT